MLVGAFMKSKASELVSTPTRMNHYISYNSEAKQPEHVFVNLFIEENRNSPNNDADDSHDDDDSPQCMCK